MPFGRMGKGERFGNRLLKEKVSSRVLLFYNIWPAQLDIQRQGNKYDNRVTSQLDDFFSVLRRERKRQFEINLEMIVGRCGENLIIGGMTFSDPSSSSICCILVNGL